jgi:photosystem II stability/assembly factor-like uncharacterized protein
MKRLLTIVLFMLLLIGCQQDIPTPAHLTPTVIEGLELTFMQTGLKKAFRSVHFTNEIVGYIAGQEGALYKTDDGGTTWVALDSHTSAPLHDIFFLNNNEGFVVGGRSSCEGTGCTPEGAVLLHTVDAGKTWNHINILTTEKVELQSVWFTTATRGFAVGGGSILSTVDGGVTWEENKINNIGGIMMDVKFVDEINGFITCTFGKLLKTVDGGLSWSISNPYPSWGHNTLALVNRDLIFSAGYAKIQKSSDLGNRWSDLPTYPAYIYKLVFVSEKNGYAFGRGQ